MEIIKYEQVVPKTTSVQGRSFSWPTGAVLYDGNTFEVEWMNEDKDERRPDAVRRGLDEGSR